VGERAGHVGTTDASSDPAAIAEEIEQTRTVMSGTIEAIQDRLAPERLTDQAVGAATEVTEQAKDAALEAVDHAIKEANAAARELVDHAIGEAKAAVRDLAAQGKTAVREATVGRVEQMASNTRDTAQYVAANTRQTAQHVRADLLTTVKQNPIPAALTAIGLSWLWTHRSGSPDTSHDRQYPSHYGGQAPAWGSRSDYAAGPRYGGQSGWDEGTAGQSVGQGVGQAMGQAKQMPGQAMGQVQEVAGQVQDAAGQAVDQAQQVAGQVGQQAKGAFWQMLDANPMAVGALGAVIGGVTALMLPETEKENRVLGETRDRVMDRVQEAAGGAVDKVQQVAEEVAEAGAKEAKYQGLIPDGGADAS
jgi:hypothetical protein